MLEIAAIVWILCGVLSYGYAFGYFQREYPSQANQDYNKDTVLASIFALLGVVALVVIFLVGGYKHGLKWR